MSYRASEGNLPKWAQELINQLRAENLELIKRATGLKAAHIVALDQDWFVMPGPNANGPTIRVWKLSDDAPELLATLEPGSSLMFQAVRQPTVLRHDPQEPPS